MIVTSTAMGPLKELLSGHEAFFAATDAEKGWGKPAEATTTTETTDEEVNPE